jgi:hypothetical protein
MMRRLSPSSPYVTSSTKSHSTDLNVATHFALHPRLKTGYESLSYKKKLSLNVRVGQNEINYKVITTELTLVVIMSEESASERLSSVYSAEDILGRPPF